MNSKNIQITKFGLESLKKEYHKLVNVKRPKLVERLTYASREGDLAENNDYANAKEELEFLDGRIAELEEVLRNAHVTASNGKSHTVSVGTKVTLKTKGHEIVFHIVGEWEADPINKKISHESPLGRALVGKKAGQSVEIEVPAGRVLYEILAIE